MATSRATSPPPAAAGTLYIVATPIGNLRDITLRALDILREVSLIAAEDTRRTAKLLTHYGIVTRTQSLHAHNEHDRAPGLLEQLRAGTSVALVTDAGTPAVSDPGGRLVSAALSDGIRVEPVPGPSAILAALTMSGFAGEQFTFVGFPPSRSNSRKKWLRALGSETRPTVLFEAPHRIHHLLGDLIELFGDIEVAVCREITKIHEELVKGPISVVLDRLGAPKGELTVILPALSGHLTEPAATPSDSELAIMVGQMTEYSRSKRGAVREVASRVGLTPREVYRRVEADKNR